MPKKPRQQNPEAPATTAAQPDPDQAHDTGGAPTPPWRQRVSQRLQRARQVVRGCLKRFGDWFEGFTEWLKAVRQSWPILLLEILSFFGIVVAVIALSFQLIAQREQWAQQEQERTKQQEEREARERELIAREEERVARAWNLLTTKASGNSGKLWALEFLHKRGDPLYGIDLSPGAGAVGAYLQEAKLAKAEFIKANFTRADLSGADLAGALFYESDLTDVRFWDLSLFRIRFETHLKTKTPVLFKIYEQFIEQILPSMDKEKFPGEFKPNPGPDANSQDKNVVSNGIGFRFLDVIRNPEKTIVEIIRAFLGIHYKKLYDGLTIRRSNVSGARFFEPVVKNVTFESSWAWKDNPPRGLPKAMLAKIAMCDCEAVKADRLFEMTRIPYRCIRQHAEGQQ